MTTNFVSTELTFVNLQMAAEALLDQFNYTTRSGLIAALEAGNNHASKFTTTQAQQFANEWEVVAHQPTTTSKAASAPILSTARRAATR